MKFLKLALASALAFGVIETSSAATCDVTDVTIALDADGLSMNADSCGFGSLGNDMTGGDTATWDVNLDGAGNTNPPPDASDDWLYYYRTQIEEGDELTPPSTSTDIGEGANALNLSFTDWATLDPLDPLYDVDNIFATGTFSLRTFDPLLIVLKDGAGQTSSYAWYLFTGKTGPATGTWSTANPFDGKNLSHMTAYAIGPTTGEPPQLVPVPAAVWLFGSGLLGLVGVARRRKHQ